jgi:hypothetical protein
LEVSVKNLQAQVESQSSLDLQAAKKLVAAVVSFWDLREAALHGLPFAPQLTSLRSNADGDIIIGEQAARLAPYADSGFPTLAQLRETLGAEEAKLAAPDAAPESVPTLWSRIKIILRPLLTVHAAHRAELVALEKALETGQDDQAREAFKALPQELQNDLADWQAKLETRADIDEALRILSAHFAQGGAS